MSLTRFFLGDEFSSRSPHPPVSASAPSLFSPFLLVVFVTVTPVHLTERSHPAVKIRPSRRPSERNGSSKVCVNLNRSSVSHLVASGGEKEEYGYQDPVLQLSTQHTIHKQEKTLIRNVLISCPSGHMENGSALEGGRAVVSAIAENWVLRGSLQRPGSCKSGPVFAPQLAGSQGRSWRNHSMSSADGRR